MCFPQLQRVHKAIQVSTQPLEKDALVMVTLIVLKLLHRQAQRNRKFDGEQTQTILEHFRSSLDGVKVSEKNISKLTQHKTSFGKWKFYHFPFNGVESMNWC